MSIHNHSYIGYTYCIKFLPTCQVYYGSRCAKNCHPSEFWVTYFTSSKTVHNLIEEYGKDSFIFEIRKTFSNNPKDAQSWERRVLKKIKSGKRQDFLNKSDGVAPMLSGWKNPFYGKKHSEKTRKIMSKKAKDRNSDPRKNNMYGRHHSEETKQKFSEQRKGVSYDQRYGSERADEIKKKASEKLSGANNPNYGKQKPRMIGDLNPMKQKDVIEKHALSIKNRPKTTCPHCNKVMDYGGFSVHKRSLEKKGIFNFE